MKAYIAKLMLLAPVVLSFATQAATPTADLKVKGKLGVPTCTVIAPDNGVYDLGKISATNVKSGTATTALPTVTKTWQVTCDAETYLNFVPTDNRRESRSDVSSALNFGLGNINNTGKIGFYTVEMKNTKVDGLSSLVFYKNGSAGAFTVVNSASLQQGYMFGWAATTTTQQYGKVFTADMVVGALLAGTTTMNGVVTEDANIDGSITMQFAFGI
ncbi:DUF1120 domain-containing protein [Yersinia hibernica]|uniref:DUF1120 domain-containing protein n=1 Tax=Yersinia enterocolitica LC20 TaxID=1443113 RepID=A0A7U4K1J5_YEREN|nr:DUF1120 domain-containing protein [Yersinia hibernica]AHM74126.1 DUF1120 domain-containing protein [Yersinia hibernica]OVZ75940.1 fimbrial assembly protein [Yersinia kristensenii]